ncbi:hypothetical protein [Psychrobacter sp. NPDC078631]|uniref:hypothetical protein n=1 Tax=Psychrobacter sp. NPDC078631 TaxID=3390666 RepID=UPI003D069BD5
MNRWHEAYNETKEEFEKIDIGIRRLKSHSRRILKQLDIDSEISTDINQNDYLDGLDRFMDAYSKLKSSLINIDFNIIPLGSWRETKDLMQNISNILAHSKSYIDFDIINQLNFYLDELIKTLAPYCDFGSNQLASVERSLTLKQHQFNKEFEEFKTRSSSILDKEERILNEASSRLNSISKIDESFKKLNEQYFLGTDEPPLRDKWALLNEQITKKSNEIDIFYRTLITDKKSIRQEIMSAGDIIQKLRNDSSIAYDKLQDSINDIKVFHQDIYGSDDGKTIGLKSDIESRRKELTNFEALQKDKYDALNQQIESLLPGATSAGLSSAYHTLSNSYDKPIKYNTWIFFGSIIMLSVLSFIFLSSSTIEFNSFKDIGTFLAYRLPIIIPVIWIAVFASKRRSEAERLKQEYAHKEALAKSYQSFKIQIEELGDEAKEPLMEKLLKSAIDTISNNASLTLDKKHGDSMPLISLIERTVDKAVEKFPTKLKNE